MEMQSKLKTCVAWKQISNLARKELIWFTMGCDDKIHKWVYDW
jgi:hypothetical protein